MATVYLEDQDNEARKRRPGVVMSTAGGITVLLFLAIPFTQQISAFRADVPNFRDADFVQPPPPPPPPEQQPPPEPEREEQKPELEKEPPRMNLAQLEAALNPGTGGAVQGDFGMSLARMAADDLDRIFELTEIDRHPQPIFQVPPTYPFAMSRAGIEGRVSLLFVVDREGRPNNIRVESATRQEFERPAIEALRQWRFEPGIRNGVTVSVRMSLPLVFRLN